MKLNFTFFSFFFLVQVCLAPYAFSHFELQAEIHAFRNLRAVSYSNGELIGAYGSGSIVFWSAEDLTLHLREFDAGGTIEQIALSADGKKIAVALNNHYFCIYDRRGDFISRTSTGGQPIKSIAFNPLDDNKVMITIGAGSLLIYHKGKIGKKIIGGTAEGQNLYRHAIYSPDGTQVAASFGPRSVVCPHSIGIWEMKDGQIDFAAQPWDLTYKKFSASKEDKLRSTHFRYEIDHSKNKYRMICEEVSSIAYSPCGTVIAVGLGDGSFLVRGTAKGSFLFRSIPRNDPVTALAFSPTENLLVVGTKNGSLVIWDTEKWQELQEIWRAHRLAVVSLVFSPDGQSIASAGENENIQIWRQIKIETKRPRLDDGTH